MLFSSLETLLPKATGVERSSFESCIPVETVQGIATLFLPCLAGLGKALVSSKYLSWHSLQLESVCFSFSSCESVFHASMLKVSKYSSHFF